MAETRTKACTLHMDTTNMRDPFENLPTRIPVMLALPHPCLPHAAIVYDSYPIAGNAHG